MSYLWHLWCSWCSAARVWVQFDQIILWMCTKLKTSMPQLISVWLELVYKWIHTDPNHVTVAVTLHTNIPYAVSLPHLLKLNNCTTKTEYKYIHYYYNTRLTATFQDDPAKPVSECHHAGYYWNVQQLSQQQQLVKSGTVYLTVWDLTLSTDACAKCLK